MLFLGRDRSSFFNLKMAQRILWSPARSSLQSSRVDCIAWFLPLRRLRFQPSSLVAKGQVYSLEVTQKVFRACKHLSVSKLLCHSLVDETSGSFHRRNGEPCEWVIDWSRFQRTGVFSLFTARSGQMTQLGDQFWNLRHYELVYNWVVFLNRYC